MIATVTGHRPEKLPESYGASPKLDDILRQAFLSLGVTRLRTGMALGVDQAAARACIAAGIPFEAYVPFKGQESMWPESSQAEYRRLLQHATSVKVCSPGGYEAKKMQIRNEAMIDDGIGTDDECELVIAVFDGSPGGTANAVAHARAEEVPLKILHPKTVAEWVVGSGGEIRWEGSAPARKLTRVGHYRPENLPLRADQVYAGRSVHPPESLPVGASGWLGKPKYLSKYHDWQERFEREYFLPRVEKDSQFANAVRAQQGKELLCYCVEGVDSSTSDVHCHAWSIAKWVDSQPPLSEAELAEYEAALAPETFDVALLESEALSTEVIETSELYSFDLETHAIQPGLLAPPIVCGSIVKSGSDKARLLLPSEIPGVIEPVLKDANASVIGANIAYDMVILCAYFPELLPLIFKAYEEGRVYDVQIAQALDAIANGYLAKDPRTGGPLYNPETGKRTDRYSLYTCVDLTLGRSDAKIHDYWRVRYAILDRLSLKDWPEEAKVYPCDDVNNALEVAEVQLGLRPNPLLHRLQAFRNLHNMPDQARAAFAVQLASVWGLRTSRTAVETLAAKVDERHADAVRKYTGIFIREDGTESQSAVKNAVAKAFRASGDCPTCGGTVQCAFCNGTGQRAVKNSKTGKTRLCSECAGVGKVRGKTKSAKSGSYITCKVQLRPEDGAWIGCDGTGLDLGLAPTLPRSDKGGIKTDRDTLEESGDDTLEGYATVSEAEKLRGTYIPFLRQGIDRPINSSANVLLETGRLSYAGPIQQIPRKGGVRECFVAREGRVFCSTDYSALELCTLAQVCLWIVGYSRMAEVINETGDPGSLHTALAASMIGVDVAEMKRLVKLKDKKAVDYRQASKKAGFGYPGGMGPAKLVLASRKRSEGETTALDGTVYAGLRFCILLGRAERCGIEMVTAWGKREIPPTCKTCIECAADLKKQWLNQWPEMGEYFKYIAWLADREPHEVEQLVSKRVRGGIDFSSAANGFFQGLAADGAKRALWLVTRECYMVPDSPLYGTRPAIFVHDEIFSEMPEDLSHLAGPRQAELMIQGMKEYTPDVKIAVEPTLMRYWAKDAETLYDESGKLLVWTPELAKEMKAVAKAKAEAMAQKVKVAA